MLIAMSVDDAMCVAMSVDDAIVIAMSGPAATVIATSGPASTVVATFVVVAMHHCNKVFQHVAMATYFARGAIKNQAAKTKIVTETHLLLFVVALKESA